MDDEVIWSQEIKQYGDQHSRQRVLLERRLSTGSESSITVVYIHGGGWRDYREDHQDFVPTINVLKTDQKYKEILLKISSFVSIDYGLSPYPGQPSDDSSRNLRHPQHIEDLAKAIEWLKLKHSKNYVLVGHSCGATLAFQVVKRLRLQPKAIVGLAGIYDIVKFVEDERQSQELYPIYKQIVVGAFGEAEDVWTNASPASYSSADLPKLLEGSKTIIGHSKSDELCRFAQSETMDARLKEAGIPAAAFIQFENSRHDEMWQKGLDVAEAIAVAIRSLDSREISS
jgi:kynurenine formamidase